jgi:hypothetical protein
MGRQMMRFSEVTPLKQLTERLARRRTDVALARMNALAYLRPGDGENPRRTHRRWLDELAASQRRVEAIHDALIIIMDTEITPDQFGLIEAFRDETAEGLEEKSPQTYEKFNKIIFTYFAIYERLYSRGIRVRVPGDDGADGDDLEGDLGSIAFEILVVLEYPSHSTEGAVEEAFSRFDAHRESIEAGARDLLESHEVEARDREMVLRNLDRFSRERRRGNRPESKGDVARDLGITQSVLTNRMRNLWDRLRRRLWEESGDDPTEGGNREEPSNDAP